MTFRPRTPENISMTRSQAVHGTSCTRLEPVDPSRACCPSLTDLQVQELAHYAILIERHYKRPMDIEWGLDGEDGLLYILQARPETVKSQRTTASRNQIIKYSIAPPRADEAPRKVLVVGRAVGQKVTRGRVRHVASANLMSLVEEGDVLVTETTDPGWEPIMRRAAAIVTNRGGRTCHAAIVCRKS